MSNILARNMFAAANARLDKLEARVNRVVAALKRLDALTLSDEAALLKEQIESLAEPVARLTESVTRAKTVDRRQRLAAQAAALAAAERREEAEEAKAARREEAEAARAAEAERREEAEEAEAERAAEASRARFKMVPLGLEIDGKIVVPQPVLDEVTDYMPWSGYGLISGGRKLPVTFAYETATERVAVTVTDDGATLTTATGEFVIPFNVARAALNASADDDYCDDRAEAKTDNLPYCRIVRS